jgi:ATP-dependent helicase/nuclease subunit A
MEAEVAAILNHQALAPVFGPASRAEVPLTGVVAGQVVGGLVDRLAVLPGRVLVVDFKTNRAPPPRLDDTPVLYLRQMAAYRAVLCQIFPHHGIECALIWTREARISWLPDSLLDRHSPAASVAA